MNFKKYRNYTHETYPIFYLPSVSTLLQFTFLCPLFQLVQRVRGGWQRGRGWRRVGRRRVAGAGEGRRLARWSVLLRGQQHRWPGQNARTSDGGGAAVCAGMDGLRGRCIGWRKEVKY